MVRQLEDDEAGQSRRVFGRRKAPVVAEVEAKPAGPRDQRRD